MRRTIGTAAYTKLEKSFELHALRSGERFVDVSANTSSYSVLAGSPVGAEVVAVEPVPETSDALLRNATLNRLTELVCCVNARLGETDGELLFASG